jgi:hypothetical protein
VLFRKHPELRRRWRAERLTRAARVISIPPIRGFLDGLPDDEMGVLEEQALNLGAGCEGLDGPVIDNLYLALLEYFVLKGMLVGDLAPDRAVRPQRALLVFGLLHQLGVLLDGPGGFRLTDLDSGPAVARSARRYDGVRRTWPRPLRWLALSPVRALIPQGR